MDHVFPLDNIRYFYNPHVADGWPDLYVISIRRQVLDWIAQNSLGTVAIVVNQGVTRLSLEEAWDFNLSKLAPEVPELLSSSLNLDFQDEPDQIAFSAQWRRMDWTRRKVFNTKYTSELFTIANCLWRVKAELLTLWPDFMNTMVRNIQGQFDYCTFEEERRCVIGFEFEHEEDAAVFDLLRPAD